MGRLCVICKEEEHPYNNRSFHKFPTDNELRTKWMNAAGLTSISKKTVICNEHFDDSSFHKTAGYTIRRRLLSNAVPNIDICREQRILQVAHSKNSTLRDNRSLILTMSSDGGKRGKKSQKDEEELVGAVSLNNDKNQGEKSDEIERKRKLQNKVRCKRYRDKRKSDITINSRIVQHQPITVEEEIIIKRRKEQDKQKSKRYRDKKRAANLINLQKDQPSKTIAKHVLECQNFHTSQIPGPITANVPYIPPTYTPSAAGPSLESFSCNICSKSFSQSSSLKIHMTAVHRLEPIYKCGYCDKRFDKKSAIVLHIKAHGDIQTSGNKSTDSSDLTPLPGPSEKGKAEDKMIWAPQSPAVSNTSITSTFPATANVKLLFVTRVPQSQVSSNTSATPSTFTTSTASYQALVVPRLPTIEPIPPPTTSIIKEEVNLEEDDVRNSPELSSNGDQMEFEKEFNEEQYDLANDIKQGNTSTTSDNEVNYQTKKAGLVEPEEQTKAGTHEVSSTQISGLSNVLKRADSLSLDIENILTNNTFNFGDINPTLSTYARKSMSQQSANTVPTLGYFKTKHSELEVKLRIYYLKTMIKKEAELIDLKIKLNKLKIIREEVELSNKRQIHSLRMENLELENAKLKLQLQKMTM